MAEPRFLRLPSSGSLQYSMRHLKSSVVDLGLPDFINKLIPVVEAQFVSPVANTADSGTKTTGTINPGLIYVEKTYQIAVEAIVPINRDSGANVGVAGQLHFYLARPVSEWHRPPDLFERHQHDEDKMIGRIATVAPLLAAGIAAANAHAMLDRASPPVGSTVAQAPSRLTLSFTEKLEPAFSGATVTNASGQRVDTAERASGSTLQISLKSLPPGAYKVHWHVLSVDTHKTEGSYSFSVGR
jgi:methionine-rich copper-binding protein CopC